MKYTIPSLPLSIDVETTAILKQTIKANKLLGELKGVVKTMPNASILINTLSLQEAKDSSAIESIVTTHDELYKAELFAKQYTTAASKEVMNYSEALRCGFKIVKTTGLLTNNTIIEIYQKIKNNSAGFRVNPGTNLVNDKTKEIIYEPPQNNNDIRNYMNNLESFINNSELSDIDPLIKMAIIHHQFESIHPFSDGNGRTGRIINILYLVQQNLLDLPVLYLSRYIIRNKAEYYRLLQNVRDNNKWEQWILFILKGVEQTATETILLVEGVKSLMQEYKIEIRTNLKRVYSQDLLNNLFRHPYTKIEFIMKELDVSRPTATSYLNQLNKLGVVQKLKLGREYFYLNPKLFHLLMNAFHVDNIEEDSIDSQG